MTSSEWRIEKQRSVICVLVSSSPFATRHSLFAFFQHASANQRFHVSYVLAADLVGDRADAGRARHRVPSEEQVIAGADQAGVEQHRIDAAELAGLDAFGQQAAMKIQQGRDEE